MAEAFDTVVLVVDKHYGSRLDSLLADPVAIWIIDSPVNRLAAESYRQQKREADVTTFKNFDRDSATVACLGILETLDLHHGEYSGGYSVLEVIGTPATEELCSALNQLGFSRFESTADGFRATRS